VVAIITVSIQDLLQSSPHTSAFYLANSYTFLADANGYYVSIHPFYVTKPVHILPTKVCGLSQFAPVPEPGHEPHMCCYGSGHVVMSGLLNFHPSTHPLRLVRIVISPILMPFSWLEMPPFRCKPISYGYNDLEWIDKRLPVVFPWTPFTICQQNLLFT
jgi:hypothetical protein